MCLFLYLMIRRPPRSTLFPSRRSSDLFVTPEQRGVLEHLADYYGRWAGGGTAMEDVAELFTRLSGRQEGDRKSTRLNSSHGYISYAVFCLKKKKKYKLLVQS